MRSVQLLKLSLVILGSFGFHVSLLAAPKNVVVAVIDTGIDIHHQKLSNNIWKDPASSLNEVRGWNFVTNKPNPSDENGHGTHIAGIIRSGTPYASPISIMPLKYYSEGGDGNINLKHSVMAIHYAIDHGAKIINYSGGGPGFSQDEFAAIKRAQAHGILLVSAAGNEQQDIDLKENHYFPSAYRSYGLTNIITVAALNKEGRLLVSSNWGKSNVDVAAPGERVYSTLPRNRFGYMSGTSQATAFVTAVAAALLTQNPKLTPQEIRNIIINSVDRSPELKNKIGSGGKLNSDRALLSTYREFNVQGISTVTSAP